MTDRINPWKYVKVDPDSVRNNPYVNPRAPPQTLPPADAGGEAEGGDEGSGSQEGESNPDIKVIDAKDFITLENIVCYGSDGQPFEQHDKLEFAKDVVRQKDGKSHASFTPYKAISHFEKSGNGLFLPSYACHTAALVALFNASVKKKADGSFKVINPALEKVLQQYKNYGPGHGYHNNNTIVDGVGGSIIHYPSKDDFPQHGGTVDINKARQKVIRPFPIGMNRSNSSLEDALIKDKQKLAYHKDLTGLKNPGVLLDLAKYFGRTAWVWPAASDRVCSAWLGCNKIGREKKKSKQHHRRSPIQNFPCAKEVIDLFSLPLGDQRRRVQSHRSSKPKIEHAQNRLDRKGDPDDRTRFNAQHLNVKRS